jgi:aminocarboxymuconate-semialdehyde decarboxylase
VVPEFWKKATNTPQGWTLDQTLAAMDANGVATAIASFTGPGPWLGAANLQASRDLARQCNEYQAKLTVDHSGRFGFFATLPLPDVEASLMELERIKDAPGIVGIGVGSNFDGVALDDHRLESMWARIAEIGLPVSEHPMLPTFAQHLPGYALPIRVGFPFDTTLCVTRMIYGGVFERHPKLSFIVPHTGSAFLGLLERLDHGFHLFHECREYITQLPSVFANEQNLSKPATGPS